jgi:hypothetical protein
MDFKLVGIRFASLSYRSLVPGGDRSGRVRRGRICWVGQERHRWGWVRWWWVGWWKVGRRWVSGDRPGEDKWGRVGEKWVGWGWVGQDRVNRERVGCEKDAADHPSFNWFTFQLIRIYQPKYGTVFTHILYCIYFAALEYCTVLTVLYLLFLLYYTVLTVWYCTYWTCFYT